MVIAKLNVPRIEEAPLTLDINIGDLIVVVGPNGAGKSALAHYIYKTLGRNAEWLPGHRAISFSNTDVGLSSFNAESVLNSVFQNEQADGRSRHALGEQHLKAVMQKLVDKYNQQNADKLKRMKHNWSNAKAVDEAIGDIISELNNIFRQGALEVQFKLVDGLLKACRGNSNPYSVRALSDGERAALYLCCSSLVRPKNSVLIVDEPERHLNPAIAKPFLSALIGSRPQVAFVFSTHDLALMESLYATKSLVVFNSQPLDPNATSWKFDLRELTVENEELTNAARLAVLGGRRKILFVEGNIGSPDIELYRHLYTDWHIAPVEGCGQVIQSVKGISSNPKIHWVEVAGIIDRDSRTDTEVNSLATRRIHAISCCTVESLLCMKEVVSIMSQVKHDAEGGKSADERVAEAERKVLEIIPNCKDEFISRKAAWRINRAFEIHHYTKEQIKNETLEPVTIDLNSIKSEVQSEVEALMCGETNLDLISRNFPIRNSAVPAAIAKCVGFRGWEQYKNSVFHHLRLNSSHGEKILETLRSYTPHTL